MRWQLLLAALVVMLVGCSSSGGGRASIRGADSGRLSGTGHAPTGLTGYGASRAEWNANHAADPDPHLDQGCCYGPVIDAPDNGGTADTWNLAGSAPDVISLLTHNFPPDTAGSDALSAVVSMDLPPDATMVLEDNSDPSCDAYAYRSARLAAADPSLGGDVEVSLYSSVTVNDYNAADVRSAQLSPGSSPSC